MATDAHARPIEAPPAPKTPAVTLQGLRHAAANLALALGFFAAASPSALHHASASANVIWMIGAAAMGVFSLIRVAPTAAMVNVRAVTASAAMLLAPALMRPSYPAPGPWSHLALALELAGVTLTQVARICMGRSFGILPANRGIVTAGPFRIVRHPIYAGWLMLAAGFALAYPSARNALLMLATLPFMFWRITLEEELLTEDPEYRQYAAAVPFRLMPGIY